MESPVLASQSFGAIETFQRDSAVTQLLAKLVSGEAFEAAGPIGKREFYVKKKHVICLQQIIFFVFGFRANE